MEFLFEKIDLNKSEHVDGLLSLMNDYMLDPMGLNAPLADDLATNIIKGLKDQSNYLGFLVKSENEYVALANCFIGFSTFKAKQLINIHDFIVTPSFRKNKAGKFLMDSIIDFGKNNGFCKVTLEVRDDNFKAQNLYKKVGYQECNPPMYFWENVF